MTPFFVTFWDTPCTCHFTPWYIGTCHVIHGTYVHRYIHGTYHMSLSGVCQKCHFLGYVKNVTFWGTPFGTHVTFWYTHMSEIPKKGQKRVKKGGVKKGQKRVIFTKIAFRLFCVFGSLVSKNPQSTHLKRFFVLYVLDRYKNEEYCDSGRNRGRSGWRHTF